MKPHLLVLLFIACTGQATDSDDDSAEARAQRKLVFATSDGYRGDQLGGLDGTDAICTQVAGRAGLSGTFKAWLSTATVSAASRLTHATVPYRLVRGPEVARSWADLADGLLEHAIDHDEAGVAVEPGAVWSDTRIDGTSKPWHPGGTTTENPQYDCGGWADAGVGVGMLGATDEVSLFWTNTSIGATCDSLERLYCLEQ